MLSPWTCPGWGETSTLTLKLRRSFGARTCWPTKSTRRSLLSSVATTGRSVSTRTERDLVGRDLRGEFPFVEQEIPVALVEDDVTGPRRRVLHTRLHEVLGESSAQPLVDEPKLQDPSPDRCTSIGKTPETFRFLRMRPWAVVGSSNSLKSGTSPSRAAHRHTPRRHCHSRARRGDSAPAQRCPPSATADNPRNCSDITNVALHAGRQRALSSLCRIAS